MTTDEEWIHERKLDSLTDEIADAVKAIYESSNYKDYLSEDDVVSALEVVVFGIENDPASFL